MPYRFRRSHGVLENAAVSGNPHEPKEHDSRKSNRLCSGQTFLPPSCRLVVIRRVRIISVERPRGLRAGIDVFPV